LSVHWREFTLNGDMGQRRERQKLPQTPATLLKSLWIFLN
jgi:hypothetical protein